MSELIPELDEVARLVRHSHERWDGGGYPDGLSGERIPLGSRIVFCADTFHAIRSDRPYRRGRSAQDALDEVKRNAGSQFDPEVADALVKSAGAMRKTVRAGTTRPKTPLRSRRLASLLLTLAIGGSALAAGGSHFLPGESNSGPGAKEAAPAPAPTRALAPEAVGEPAETRRTRDSAVTDNPTNRGDVRAPAAAGRTSRRDEQPGASGRSGRRAAGTQRARDPGLSPAVPRRHRVGRPASPGRSGEAPRRPARPGKPVGGAPDRSEGAPGRPSRPVNPPARPVKPQTGPAKPQGNAKHR